MMSADSGASAWTDPLDCAVAANGATAAAAHTIKAANQRRGAGIIDKSQVTAADRAGRAEERS
jgi:hypothetical protein